MPCTQKIKDLGWKPNGASLDSPDLLPPELLPLSPFAGVILSGSPYSVYDRDSPHVDPDVFELGVPILGICYGLQVCAQDLNSDDPLTKSPSINVI
jgi:GMP synthase (glutamine-hydrolysing)